MSHCFCLSVLLSHHVLLYQLSDAARKKFQRCENIRMDWGLEVDKEDIEKIYDEPTELLTTPIPCDDTKVVETMSLDRAVQ